MRSIHEGQQKNPLPWIVIAGGPGSGKSGVTNALRERLPDLYFQMEGASAIFGTGVKVPTRGLYLQEFNRSFGKILRHFETLGEIHAENVGARAVVFDRALPDLLAYLEGGEEEFQHLTGFSLSEAYTRYGMVIYLEMPPRQTFEAHRQNNRSRYEKSYEEAVDTSLRTWSVYRNHPNFTSIQPTIPWEERVQMVEDHIVRFLWEVRSSS